MGTVRIADKSESYKLSRLCVLKEYRGFHFGEDLVTVREMSPSRLLTPVPLCFACAIVAGKLLAPQGCNYRVWTNAYYTCK